MSPLCTIGGCAGDVPNQTPCDRWVMEGALLIIAAEDPDVLYILPGSVDYAQHHSGAADNPGEWSNTGEPELLWDDLSRFNRHANREPVLDVVHEADDTFGLLVGALQARGTYDDSIVILAADHGQVTSMYHVLRVKQICLDAGVPPEAFDLFGAKGGLGFIWLADPVYAPAAESALQGYVTQHPISGETVKPLVVLTRGEMETGVDDVMGRLAASSGPKRAELYSEWCIDHPVNDHSKPKWPDAIVMSRYRFQLNPELAEQPLVGTHGTAGRELRIPLAFRGPRFKKGVFDEDWVRLVDIAPTLYYVQGWGVPGNVDGRVLTAIVQ